MDYRNPKHMRNGSISCELDHPLLGWIPFTARPDDPEKAGADLYSAIVQSEEIIPEEAETPIEDAKAMAFVAVSERHADLLCSLTGNASAEERDTWAIKAAAATAYLAGNATSTQTAMIEMEATGDACDPSALARKICDKSEQYHVLVGQVGALRSKAKKAVSESVTAQDLMQAMTAFETEADSKRNELNGGT